MTRELVEILGIFLLIVGAGLCVSAAYIVSVALAVLVAGVFALFAGVIVVYLANARPAMQVEQRGERP